MGRFAPDVGLDVRRLAGAVPAFEVDELVGEGASGLGDGLLDGEPDGGSISAAQDGGWKRAGGPDSGIGMGLEQGAPRAPGVRRFAVRMRHFSRNRGKARQSSRRMFRCTYPAPSLVITGL